MISERLGGLGVDDSWYLPVNKSSEKTKKQLRSNTQRPVVGCERITNLQSHDFLKENYQHQCHPLSISSFATCIISSHMGRFSRMVVEGGNPGNPLKGHGEDWIQSGMTVYSHVYIMPFFTICNQYVYTSLDLDTSEVS